MACSSRADRRSDVDFVDRGCTPPDPRTLDLLAEALEAAAGRRIDLVDLATAPPLLVHEVVRSGRCIVRRDPAERAEFEAKTTLRYLGPHLRRLRGDDYLSYAARPAASPGWACGGDIGGPMAVTREGFVPALGVDWLTPLYDWVGWLAGEGRFKRRLVEGARIMPGHRVLDLGCGTGTLVLLVKRMCPGTRVTGIDIDPKILGMARAKIIRAGADIPVEEGSATALPFAEAVFDRVLTSLVLHHLTTAQKRAALREVRRVLAAGGELHVADFGKPHNLLMHVASLGFQWFDGGEAPAANLRGELPALLTEAGFAEVAETERWMTPFGTLAFVRGRVPD